MADLKELEMRWKWGQGPGIEQVEWMLLWAAASV
jgi:hypothetical protein